MSANANRAQVREAGFTLIEMLVVLAILALVASFAGPLLSRGSDGLSLEIASGELAAALRATRSAAIARNAATILTIDVDRRTFASPVVSQRAFSRDIEAKLTFAAGIGSSRPEGGFQFFPDGSSTGGDIALALHGKQTKLCVDWLTGTVRKTPAC